MIQEYILAFGFILLAEMGDKTQLLAMAFATKYRIRDVIIGIAIGSFFNHLIAVAIGYGLKLVIPLDILGIIAGVAFIIFGYWSVTVNTEENDSSLMNRYGAIFTVSMAYFIGELADKTQFTAITLATQAEYPIFILLGTVSGMIVSGIIAIIIAIWIGKKIPEFYMKIGASLLFIFFGIVQLVTQLPSLFTNPLYVVLFGILVLYPYYLIGRPLYMAHKQGISTIYQRTAEALKEYFVSMESALDAICLTEDVCGSCSENGCLIGYTKNLIKTAVSGEEITVYELYKNYKTFNKSKVIDAYLLTIKELRQSPDQHTMFLLFEIAHALENILLSTSLEHQRNIVEYVKQIKQIDQKLYQTITSKLKE